MGFVYDSENQCFSMEIDNILFSCETLDQSLESVAARLAEIYEKSLPAIAGYVVGSSEFLDVYGEMTKEELLNLFRQIPNPWIFLQSNGSGTIAFCTPDYVIELAFAGDFKQFESLHIDG